MASTKYDKPVIEVDHVSKAFPLGSSSRIIARISGKRPPSENSCFQALKDISFQMEQGEAVGILGENGSGKSTLLQIIAGTLKPTQGKVITHGRIAALLELGSGFDPDFTGRENVFINASIHGLSNRKTSEMFESIAAFADIGQFIEHPVRTYSSGMRMRLAFAIQIHMKPDILIVDEALSVGDDFFRQRCYNRINGLLTSGITFLFVTHNEEILRHLASRALLLHEGMLIQDSNPKQTIDAYKLLLGDKRRKSVQDRILRHKKTSKAQNPQEAKTKAHASICNVVIQSADGMPCNYFHPGHPMKIVLKGTCQTSVENLSVGIRIRNKEGLKIYSWATANQDEHTVSEGGSNPLFREKARGVSGFEVEFSFNCHLGKNLYYVEAYLANEDIQIRQNKQILDWVSEAAFFRVHFEDNGYFFGGVSDLKMNASWHMGTEESDPK